MSLKLLLLAVVILTLLPILLAAACGRSLLYYPTRLSSEELKLLARQPGWHAQKLAVAEEVELVGLVHPPTNDDATWLLFFGGNAMGIVSSQSVLELVAGDADRGLAVWAYRGYDGSDDSPTQEKLFADALIQVRFLEKELGAKRLMVIGQSLGSGIAAHVAAERAKAGLPLAGLVLLSPYRSIAAVADDTIPLIPVGWAVADPYRTDEILADIPAPVLILHGTKDSVINIEHGRFVAKELGDRGLFVELDGRSHNDLWEDARTVFAIRAFIEPPGDSHSLPKAAPSEQQ